MRKIVYIVSSLKRTGPTNQLFNIIKNLERSVFEPVLLTLSPEPKDTRWKDFESIGVDLYSLNFSRFVGLFFSKSRVKKFIDKVRPDLIHTQGIRADVLISRLGFKIPHVATIHNFPQVDYRMTYGKVMSTLMLKQHIDAMKEIDKLVGCSTSVENNLVDFYGLQNTTAIQNGVDQDFFYPIIKSECNLRKNLGIQEDDKVWISTGHLSARKDPLFLIDVWSEIEKKHPDCHLVFLGSGALATECQLRASKLKNVHLLGRVTNVVDFLQESDYFITASQSEGLPMAAIEAMACGLPLLVTNIDPYKEILSLSDEVGKTYQLGCRESFFDSFSALVEWNYTEYSHAAIELVEQKLNAKTMSESYQLIYKELLES